MNTFEIVATVSLIGCFSLGGIVCWIDSFKMDRWYEKTAERFTGTGCIALAAFFLIALIRAVMK